ncbi:Ribonuclease H-like superfamily protein [Rhynchospora pubera]|uniref:Ribonuclease H-like superfamily protein n=1 Tax=Rhynchospora pubera TaxID=906938 RepID=A0AAV8EJF7_9POAL|nr:Ribonuclease H-like superfamily protein [Rhynchospora pubera]
MTFPNGPTLTQREDRLIFIAAKNGQFSIKAAYQLLLRNSAHNSHGNIPKNICRMIWHAKGVLPRARVFLWRAVKEALPVDALFSTRLARRPHGCSICGAIQENAAHVIFKCPKAQQVWFSSDFGLRTDSLPDSVQDIIAYLLNRLDEQQLGRMIAIMWQIWKDRCKECFEGKKYWPPNTLAAANAILFNIQAAEMHFSTPQKVVQELPPKTSSLCWVDASWLHSGTNGTGMAMLLFQSDKLLQYWIATGTATSPFHAELLAFEKAIQISIDLNVIDCTFKTYCLELKRVMNDETNVSQVEWQVYHEAVNVKLLWDGGKKGRNWNCTHVGREANVLADKMAKYARSTGIEYVGYSFPAFMDM